MPVEVKLPDLGENVDSGDVVKVLVQVGDTIQVDDPLVELETGKATVEVPSTEAGRIVTVHVKAGDQIKVGQTLVTLDGEAAQKEDASEPSDRADTSEKSDEPSRTETPPVAPLPPPSPPSGSDETRRAVPASPSVRQFAREIGVDIGQVEGSGPGGRISNEDVKRYARERPSAGAPVTATVAAGQTPAPPLPDFAKFGSVRRETFDKVRQMTAQQMSLAWSTIPMVTHHEEADVTDLEGLRKRFAARAEAIGGKLTVTAILLKVVAAALRKFPKFNASIDVARSEVVYKDYVNVGVAVDTERGLLVPVVRDADGKGILRLAAELSEIAAKARERKLQPDDLAGGNFTITNLGGLGTHHFTPIINVPEVAILGVGRAEWKPVVVEGEVKPRLRMPLSLTYDHRLIDGADAARFAEWLVEALEQPFVLSLEG
jgi:pyruvate dehydrogenase E2 component (dihydrolipoamide acetyltransferase)